VAQVRNPDDGRSHYLSLTAEGKALYEQIVPAAKAMEEALLAKFSLDDRARLVSLLRPPADIRSILPMLVLSLTRFQLIAGRGEEVAQHLRHRA
jgi:DNA-binding MarR family transcriptional regulator